MGGVVGGAVGGVFGGGVVGGVVGGGVPGVEGGEEPHFTCHSPQRQNFKKVDRPSRQIFRHYHHRLSSDLAIIYSLSALAETQGKEGKQDLIHAAQHRVHRQLETYRVLLPVTPKGCVPVLVCAKALRFE